VTIHAPDWTVRATSAYNNTRLYTGREYDVETGLYHYRRRPYHAQLARFTNRDPIGYEAGDENLYRYVWNMPCTHVDPYGLDVGCEPGQCDIALHGYTIKGAELLIHKEMGGRPYTFLLGDVDRNTESLWEDLKALGEKYVLKSLGKFQQALRGVQVAREMWVTDVEALLTIEADYTRKDCIDCGDGTQEWSNSKRFQEDLTIQLSRRGISNGPVLVTDLEVEKAARLAVSTANNRMRQIDGVLSNYQIRQTIAARNDCELAP